MKRTTRPTISERLIWQLPHLRLNGLIYEERHLLQAIAEAEANDFVGTRNALLEMLDDLRRVNSSGHQALLKQPH